ncbi:MAG: diaminopimelate dehydrogenase [Clostridiales bacterium]|jgi:diaminopimelate dehydrogenase|nr:diaminopimelate dehydrogenase [Clostridiales bacterium]
MSSFYQNLRIIVVGYGNIGKYAADAVIAAPDLDLTGIVWTSKTKEKPSEINGIPVIDDVQAIWPVDAALLCVPSRNVEEEAVKYLELGIPTVDSFDIHSDIYGLKTRLTPVCQKNQVSSIISAGWDPGLDSVIRAMMQLSVPRGVTYTNFGPGMSMGHTVAAKKIEGVKDAMSVTIPLGTGIHRRMVYVETKPGADFAAIQAKIKADPYFVHDETHVIKTDNLDSLMDVSHGTLIERRGVSGITANQRLEFNMKINNPALTAQIMAACARAVIRQKPSAYTMIEIPPVDFVLGTPEEIIKSLV